MREKWGLFWLITLVGSLAILALWVSSPLVGEQEYRHMIRMSVRVSWPILCVVFMASAVTKLWPGQRSQWFMINRRYIGLSFSAVMLWQIFFIVCLLRSGAQLFPPGIATLFIVSDILGYTLLLLMTVTSFSRFQIKISRLTWKRLHTFGLYYIWFIYFYSFPLGFYFSEKSYLKFQYSMFMVSAFVVLVVRIAGKIKAR